MGAILTTIRATPTATLARPAGGARASQRRGFIAGRWNKRRQAADTSSLSPLIISRVTSAFFNPVLKLTLFNSLGDLLAALSAQKQMKAPGG